MQKELNLRKRAATTSIKALLASFETSHLDAKNKRPHTTGETAVTGSHQNV
jgi:hypothetical protein